MKYKILRSLKKLGIHYPWRFILKFIKKKNYGTEGNILIKNYNAIYLPIPKVACSSVKKVITEINNLKIEDKIKNPLYKEENIHTIDFSYIKRKELFKYNNYLKFAFVRNPYDRIVSCYKNKIKNKDENRFPFINGVHKSFLLLGNFYGGMSFNNFIKEIIKISENEADGHFKSQYLFLSDKNGNLITNFVGKFETLEEDFNKIMSKIGVNGIKLPHLMKSKHKNYREYYDEETKQLVAQRYKKDLELFDYTF